MGDNVEQMLYATLGLEVFKLTQTKNKLPISLGRQGFYALPEITKA